MPLRWRLTLWHLGLTVLGVVGLIWVSYQALGDSLRSEIDQTLDERANHVADAVAVVPNRPIEGISQATTDEFRSPGVYVQLFNDRGIVVAHSLNLGSQQLPTSSAELQQMLAGQSFYLTSRVDGQPVRLYHRPLTRDGRQIGAVQVGQSLAGLEATLGRLRLIYALGTGSILVFGGVGGWVLATLGLAPVAQVAKAARETVRAEDLTRRVPYSGPADEVGNLATTFNEMLDRLQALFGAQRRFLAEAAHELRTPLASMLGNVDLLGHYGHDPARRQETVSALQRTGRHVARLLDDLLLLAQAEAGWHLELRPLAIDDIFVDVYETLRHGPGGAGLTLAACEPAQMRGDADRLRQVFLNVIDNAAKYSAPADRVVLRLWRENGQIRVTVSDQGPGIPAAVLTHIFEPFVRLPQAERVPGVGLGLAIVRWIVTEHGGQVAVESVNGVGTTFSLTFPEYHADACVPSAESIQDPL